MKTRIFAVACLAALLFTSCGKDNNDEPKTTPETAQVKHFETVMPGYDSWIYINLETGRFQQQEELGEREYRKYKSMGGTDYEVVKKEPAKGTEADLPKGWHLAFHITDARTNNGEVLMTEETDLNKITAFPTGNYVADAPADIYVDLSGMQSGGIIAVSKAMVNSEMNKWIKSTGMGKPKIVSDKVFAVKFKNGNAALIKFKDYLDKTGKQKVVSFDYKFIKKA
ncbi:HmuY family protein [Prevotella falsenii]|uniref:HmuY family protein n=1 Tax=Prevotella falsenii TaxID=515414 RepID=UPI00046A7D91|nr:HmuY family protein [Prevotella falsenii]